MAQRRALIDTYRLVYQSDSLVNWCPGLGTVLANGEVTPDGRSDRGNFPVFRKHLRQWMMRITAYADRLLDDLEYLDWPDKVKTMQRNWIGRSHGAQVRFDAGGAATLSRCSPPGPTRCSAQPTSCWHRKRAGGWAHRTSLAGGNQFALDQPRRRHAGEAVAAYGRAIAAKSDLERQENKEKTGVFLGSYAINPVNGHKLPIFIADYVLLGYGTGAIMAVPGHDQRDWEFATAFGLPIVEVISGASRATGNVAGGDIAVAAYVGDGTLVNSDYLDGLDVETAIATVTARLESDGHGEGTIHYKLRDWLFARQRYWANHSPSCTTTQASPYPPTGNRAAGETSEVEDSRRCHSIRTTRTGTVTTAGPRRSHWVEVDLDLGDGLRRYHNWAPTSMPQWAGSSWYQLRYIDPHELGGLLRQGERGVLGRPATRAARTRRSRRCRPVRRRRRARGVAPAVFAVLAQGSVQSRGMSPPASRTERPSCTPNGWWIICGPLPARRGRGLCPGRQNGRCPGRQSRRVGPGAGQVGGEDFVREGAP